MFRFTVPNFLLVSLFVILGTKPVLAGYVNVPLQLDHEHIQNLLNSRIFTGPGNSKKVWDDGYNCEFLTLSQPKVSSLKGQIRILLKGMGRVGRIVGDNCYHILNWQGSVEVFEQPLLDAGRSTVSFRVVESKIYDRDGERRFRSGILWDWIKHYIHPALHSLRIDLRSPVLELRDLLPLFFPYSNHTNIQKIIDSVTLANIKVNDQGIQTTLQLFVDQNQQTTNSDSNEPALTLNELVHWDAAWQSWDAFITFIIKHAASSTEQQALRIAFRDVLLDARHKLALMLTDTTLVTNEPVRKLFLDTWIQLSPLLKNLSGELPGKTSLRYLSFIAAIDALNAIDQFAPHTGLEISTNGLRRMTRIVAPKSNLDPLQYDQQIDQRLRDLFEFGPPPPLSPQDRSSGDFFINSAWAQYEDDRLLVPRLNRWVPDSTNANIYLPLVQKLLRRAAKRTLENISLDDRYQSMFHPMVLATAWQESCWRQFVKRGRKVVTLKSNKGAIGIMQVNPYVWRGFYNLKALRADISYNALAGSEILIHYLKNFAIAKGEHKRKGGIDNLPKAAYAAYNGGPDHLRRYRKNKIPRSLRKIDQSFLRKYKVMRDGNELAVKSCFGIN